MEPVRFGVISTAKIGHRESDPGDAARAHCRIVAIALARARRAPRRRPARSASPRPMAPMPSCSQDPEIEAVYNPLPNHLHVPISIEAAAAGKHVLCEKPIALTAEEAEKLIEARDHAGVLIQEAFMVRHHPQWRRARELVRAGRIGELRVVQGSFSYMNLDPAERAQPGRRSAAAACTTSAATRSSPHASCSAPSRAGWSARSSSTRASRPTAWPRR